MLAKQWLENARGIMTRIEETQMENIRKAAELMAETIECNRWVHTFGCGHATLPIEEMYPRIGGFVGFHPMIELPLTFFTRITGEMGVHQFVFLERVEGYGNEIMKGYDFDKRDIMWLFSHSGINNVNIDIALEARKKRIAAQIEPDGSMPRELARTLSEHYTHFNIQAFVQLAGIAERAGVDLWHFSTPDGRSVRKALEYVLPVLRGERAWELKQLRPGNPADYYPELLQAARQYPDLNLLPLADAVGGEKARVHIVNLWFGYGR